MRFEVHPQNAVSNLGDHGGEHNGETPVIRLRDRFTGAQAAIDTVGGTVRELALPFGEAVHPVLRSYPPDLFAGRILWPFCDRIPGGAYEFGGRSHRIPTNEIETGDAIHGFLYRRRLDVASVVTDESRASVVLVCQLYPADEPGYPFRLSLQVEFTLTDGTFSFAVETINTGDGPAPLSVGWHPYFAPPGPAGTVDSWLLTANTPRYYPVDESLVPVGGTAPVDGTRYDLLQSRPIGAADYDIALHGTAGDPVRASIANGSCTLHLAGYGAFSNLQLFIPPDRKAIAIEPISAPAAAFVFPELGLAILEPGNSHTARAVVRSTKIAESKS